MKDPLDCIQQDPGNWNGIIINLNIKYDWSQKGNYTCHNNLYSLIKKAFVILRNNWNNNYFGAKV